MGYQRICGPVQVMGLVTSEGSPDGYPRLVPGVVTVGNRVKAWWQGYGHTLGTGTVVGFERDEETGWVKVVVETDRPDSLTRHEDGLSRWDWDRTERVPGHHLGETQEESVGRRLASLREREQTTASAPAQRAGGSAAPSDDAAPTETTPANQTGPS